MRTYDEVIEVRRDPTAAPAQFWWRGRRWLVRGVVNRWLETGAWWDSPLVRAARGDDVVAGQGAGDGGSPEAGRDPEQAEADLLAEHEVWRVLAASGPSGSPGVYDLDLARDTGCWRLRAVVD